MVGGGGVEVDGCGLEGGNSSRWWCRSGQLRVAHRSVRSCEYADEPASLIAVPAPESSRNGSSIASEVAPEVPIAPAAAIKVPAKRDPTREWRLSVLLLAHVLARWMREAGAERTDRSASAASGPSGRRAGPSACAAVASSSSGRCG